MSLVPRARGLVPLAAAACAALVLLTLAPVIRAGQKPKTWEPVIDPANFVAQIDNPYFPLPVGRTWTYRGTTREGEETLTIEVRAGSRMILGVPTTIVVETAALDGRTIEIAENWFAQDKDGAVWYFGEFTQDFVDGVPVSTEGSWEAGVAEARPGIVMPAHPASGDTYFQEFAPGVAEDQAKVIGTSSSVSVPYGTFTGVLVTKEWTALSANSVEHKSYAPGVGLVLEEKGGERIALVSVQ